MRDLHQVVIYDVGQVVGGHAVALEQHLIVQLGGVHIHPAADFVVEAHVLLAGHLEADDVGFSGFQAALHLIGG